MVLQAGLPQKTPDCPVSLDNAHVLIIRAWEAGRIQISEHFRQRSADRKFTTLDAERILRKGRMSRPPSYCPDFENWCFFVIGESEGRTMEIRVALDFNLDLDSPVMVLITGIPKRRVTSCRSKSMPKKS